MTAFVETMGQTSKTQHFFAYWANQKNMRNTTSVINPIWANALC